MTRWHETAQPVRDGRLIAGLVPAAEQVEDPELAQTLSDIDRLITARVHARVADVLHRPPGWAVPLGPPPRDPRSRRAWLDAIGVVAGYRDLHQIQGRPLLGPADEKQPDSPPDDRNTRWRATAAAAAASRLAHQRPTPTTPAPNPTAGRSIQR